MKEPMVLMTCLPHDDYRWASHVNVCCVHANGVATTFQLSPTDWVVGRKQLECGTWVADDYAPTITTRLHESVGNIVERHFQKHTQVMHTFVELTFDRCSCGGSRQPSPGAPSVPPCIYCRLGKASRFFGKL